MTCSRCANKGVLKIQYESGEPYDLAMCACLVGEQFRAGGEALVRSFFGVPDGVHRVGWLEDFEDGPAPTLSDDFQNAGKTRKVKL